MKKVERLERAQELTDSYKTLIKHLFNDEVMGLTEEKYRSIFAPWRKAAKDLNLVLRKGGTYTANNRFRFPFIPLPENVTFLSKDLGGSIWFPVGEIIIVHVRYDADFQNPYIVTPVDTIRSDQWDYLRTHSLFRKAFLKIKWPSQISVDLEVKESKNCLSEDCLSKLFQAYWYQLSCGLFLLDSVPLFNISMWTDFHGSKVLSYHVSKDTDLFFPPETPLDIFGYGALWQSDVFRILFAATVFSITKPILQAAGLPVDFVLNLERKNGTAEDFKYYIREWFCLLCKVVTVKDDNSIEKLYKSKSFEFTDAMYADMVSSAMHHGFPYLYSRGSVLHKDKEKDTTNLCSKEFFTSREINKLRRLRNLPILLSASEVNHQYPDEKCLTINPILDFGSRDARFHNKRTRDDLLDLYSGLLRYLSEQNEQNDEKCNKEACRKEFVTQKVKDNVRKLYKTSVRQLGVSLHEEPNLQQQHTACILTALAFLRQYIEATFPDQDLSCPLGCIFHVERRFQKMAGVRTAGLVVFVEFLKSLENSKNNSLIFTQDDEYLYLHYKEYWPAFEAYCKEQNISIQYSAARFRRDILAPDFLKAQYEPTSGKYPRYDYRKKNGGKTAVVIAIAKKLISEFTPNDEISSRKHT